MPHFETNLPTCCYTECCLKLMLLFSYNPAFAGLSVCTQVSNSPFLRQTSMEHEIELPQGSPLPKMFSWCLEAAATDLSIFLFYSCVVSEDTKDTGGVNLSVSHASGSHVLTLVIFQTLQENKIRFLSGFFSFYFLNFFIKWNVINLWMRWSGVSQGGFIKHSSPER